jgi:tetratricopeptide (TPR) repeat protein
MKRCSPPALLLVLGLGLGLGLGFPATAAPQLPSGAYLAARQASMTEDFAPAARQYDRLLAAAPNDPRFLQGAVLAHIGAGQMDRAADLATRLMETGARSRAATLARMAASLRAGDYQAVVDGFAAGQRFAPMVDDLIRAWALLGAGRTADAMAAFDAGAAAGDHAPFRRYNAALARAVSGDPEGALALLDAAAQPGAEAVAARAALLAGTDRAPEALALLEATLARGDDPVLRDLQARLEAGEVVTFDQLRNPAEGIGEVFFAVASTMARNAPGTEALVHARIAQSLAPRNGAITVLVAEILEDMQGNSTWLRPPMPGSTGPRPPSSMPRSVAPARCTPPGRDEAAAEVLDALARSHPDRAQVHIARGNLMRRIGRHAEAAAAFDTAIALQPDGAALPWEMYFARGMARERSGDWDAAEADFRRALEIRPDQPDVLNYLGYSLLERKERLDEALAMIETAVAREPDAGHIVDSLAWALYRLGRFDEAVAPMERAAALLPVDPVVNDHLGDVYWMVGRSREARFQWRRALSFDPEPDAAERIRAKLARGLDAVRAEEGLPVTGRNGR